MDFRKKLKVKLQQFVNQRLGAKMLWGDLHKPSQWFQSEFTTAYLQER